MIDAAASLLEMHDLPSWSDDAPLRREMERLREDLRAYHVAAGHDARVAAKRAAVVNERAGRIRHFLEGRRQGVHFRKDINNG